MLAGPGTWSGHRTGPNASESEVGVWDVVVATANHFANNSASNPHQLHEWECAAASVLLHHRVEDYQSLLRNVVLRGDLCLRQVSEPNTEIIYFRYVYTLFGTTNPIMTLPPVQFSVNEEKHFSQGYCAFEVAAEFSEVGYSITVFSQRLVALRRHDLSALYLRQLKITKALLIYFM